MVSLAGASLCQWDSLFYLFLKNHYNNLYERLEVFRMVVDFEAELKRRKEKEKEKSLKTCKYKFENNFYLKSEIDDLVKKCSKLFSQTQLKNYEIADFGNRYTVFFSVKELFNEYETYKLANKCYDLYQKIHDKLLSINQNEDGELSIKLHNKITSYYNKKFVEELGYEVRIHKDMVNYSSVTGAIYSIIFDFT